MGVLFLFIKGGVVVTVTVKVKGITASLGNNKDAEGAALSVYKQLNRQGRYNTALDPIIKSYAITYADLMRINRATEREGGVDVDSIKLKRTLTSQINTLTKTLGLLTEVDEQVEEVDDIEQEESTATTYNIPGLP